jgi:hypothetical protein
LNKIVNDLLTGKDGKTHDIARWSWVITMAAVIVGAAYELLNTMNLSLREFAEAIGIVTGAHGAAVMLKKDAEPSGDK